MAQCKHFDRRDLAHRWSSYSVWFDSFFGRGGLWRTSWTRRGHHAGRDDACGFEGPRPSKWANSGRRGRLEQVKLTLHTSPSPLVKKTFSLVVPPPTKLIYLTFSANHTFVDNEIVDWPFSWKVRKIPAPIECNYRCGGEALMLALLLSLEMN